MEYLESIMEKNELSQYVEEELTLEDFIGSNLEVQDEYEFNEEEIQANIDWCESYMPKYEFFTEEIHRDNMNKIMFLMKEFISKDDLEAFNLDIEKQVSKLVDNNEEELLILFSLMADGINKKLIKQYSINKRLDIVIGNLIKIIKTVDLDNNK